MAACCHCIHGQQNLVTGKQSCVSKKAEEEIAEEQMAVFLAGGEHDCPFFEDDELPW